MTNQQSLLNPSSVIEQFKKNGITHVVWLPDSETNWMYMAMQEEPSFDLIPVTREGEALAIAAGLYAGGKKPVCLIQNTGMFESGDSIRGIALDVNLPVVMMVGYRGWTRHGVTPDSAARFTEPILDAWGIKYYLVESDADADRITTAFEEAEATNRPVAILVGDEFHGFNR
ncbi:MAG: thiamine pyrophosphate-binding protein [Chloroflexi bacterium]|nr:thiamine pyrophosphate-binding protein [Chloroflexota bacterium]